MRRRQTQLLNNIRIVKSTRLSVQRAIWLELGTSSSRKSNWRRRARETSVCSTGARRRTNLRNLSPAVSCRRLAVLYYAVVQHVAQSTMCARASKTLLLDHCSTTSNCSSHCVAITVKCTTRANQTILLRKVFDEFLRKLERKQFALAHLSYIMGKVQTSLKIARQRLTFTKIFQENKTVPFEM